LPVPPASDILRDMPHKSAPFAAVSAAERRLNVPWNFPTLMTAWKVAFGNTVVFKPATSNG